MKNHVHSSHLDTSGITKADVDTVFMEIFALVSLFFLVKAALLSGGDNYHVNKKKGRGIRKKSEFLKWVATDGKNDLLFVKSDYEAEPAISPGKDTVGQHNEHDEEANSASQLLDGRHGFQEEGCGPTATEIGYNFIETAVPPDPPASNVLHAVQERVELPRRPDPPVNSS